MVYTVPGTHHIRLKDSTAYTAMAMTPDETAFLIKPYSYRRSNAPQFGARFSSGDPDYNSLTFWQHWAQNCWIGGLGQDNWQDDSMFDEAVGVDTSLHDRVQLSRDLTQGDASWLVDNKKNDREFKVYNEELYAMQINHLPSQADPDANGKLYKYVQGSDTWALEETFTGEYCRSIQVFHGELIVATDVSLHRFDGTTWNTVAFPVGQAGAVYAMESYRERLYVAFGVASPAVAHIWRLKTDWTWDGTTHFFESVGLGAFVTSLKVHLGYLYMMTEYASVLRSDGNNTFEIWNFGAEARAGALESYDGRLYITVTEPDGTDVTSQFVIYALSGAAMTELHRWGKVGRYGTAGIQMALHDRRMYYSGSDLLGMQPGFGITAYDSAEDAHSLFAVNSDQTTYPDVGNGNYYTVSSIVFFGGRLWISTRGYGIFRTPVSFRDYILSRSQATYDLTGTADTNGGWLISSGYDAGTPGVNKMWRRIRLETQLPSGGTTVEIDYSLDDGTTWVNAPLTASQTLGTAVVLDAYLDNIFGRRIKYRVRLQTTSEDETPVVRGIIFSYILMPDPQWQWEFIIPVADVWDLLDGSTADQQVDTERMLDYLRSLHRNQRLYDFTDINGDVWRVLPYQYSENVAHGDQGTEGDVRIVLLEAMEGDGLGSNPEGGPGEGPDQ